ncbi:MULTISPECIES: hypothetical protein [unclassified Nocardia]|uniref:hypothetical protein n=1 Tax=unclassified Nocardia TaxID=2637762 RepID=UPI001CE40736|nr:MULTISPECIES: hypothetical protein [unclassified Nocardia]
MSDTMFEQTFYTLPVDLIGTGMSTADGQDVIGISIKHDEALIVLTVYTPRSDDPAIDAINRGEPEYRIYQFGERVALAVFPNTDHDGSDHEQAVITGTCLVSVGDSDAHDEDGCDEDLLAA